MLKNIFTPNRQSTRRSLTALASAFSNSPLYAKSTLNCAMLTAVCVSSSALAQTNKQIRIGSVERDSIATRGQVDRFTFNAKDGENFQVAFVPESHLRLRIWAPNGTAKVDIDAANPIKEIFRARAEGQYIIEVKYERGTGPYHLGLERLSRPSPDSKAITTGIVVSDRIGSTAQANQYTFSASPGQRFELFVNPERSKFSIWGLSVRVFSPRGLEMARFTSANAGFARHKNQGWNEKEPWFVIPSDAPKGTYTIQVESGSARANGQYHFSISSLAPPNPNAEPKKIGDTLSGSLGVPTEVHQYRFQGRRNQKLRITLNPTGSVQVSLIAPDGSQVFRNHSPNKTTISATLPNMDGQYVLQVRMREAQLTGSYQIQLEAENTSQLIANTVGSGQ